MLVLSVARRILASGGHPSPRRRPVPPVGPVPGTTALPLDPHGDGLCEDPNGNGRTDVADVVLRFDRTNRSAANEPVAALDSDGNDRIDVADVVQDLNRLRCAALPDPSPPDAPSSRASHGRLEARVSAALGGEKACLGYFKNCILMSYDIV